MTRITPILLCGGSGTRLWPLSRKSYPKQFVPLVGAETLFQASAKRLSGAQFAAPVVVTGSDFRFIVTEQLQEIGIDPGAVMIEPEGRNTGPAVLAAALHLQAHDPEALMLVAPADHVVPNPEAFRDAVGQGLPLAQSGQIITFGITPSHPETGYGYLELTQSNSGNGPIALKRFVEKPSASQASDMLETGRFLWNAGIFLFSVQTIIEAFEAHARDLMAPVQASLSNAVTDLGFLRLEPKSWAQVPDISVDYAVMERAENLSVVPFSAGWSDLGGWDAVWRESAKDSSGVATEGPATAIDCENSLLRSDDPGLALVGIGLKDIITVAMNDAVLVADASRAQDVKQAVSALKDKSARQATEFPKDHRPWGWFESLVVGEHFQVKRIHVKPGGRLSLQSHKFRSEHWIVVEGTATVTVGEEVKCLPMNHSVYIPVGAKHRMENLTDEPMVLIEVQTGTYFGEDDIVRYDDVYARGLGTRG